MTSTFCSWRCSTRCWSCTPTPTAVPLTKLLELIGDRARRGRRHRGRRRSSRARAGVGRRAGAGGRRGRDGPALVSRAGHGRGHRRRRISPSGSPALDEAQSELLQKLLEGSPVGRTRDAAPGTPPDRPVQRLLAAGLLRQVDAETVILPRLVGQVLRGELPGPVAADRTRPRRCRRPPSADVDAVAAGAVIDLLREVEVVLETLSATPVPELRSGGLGVRDVKRLTKVTGIDEQPAGADPRGDGGGRADRGGHAGTGAAGRRGPVLGADGGRRPIRRIPDGGQVAPAGVDVAGPAGQAEPGRRVAAPTVNPMRHFQIRCSPPPRRWTGGCCSTCSPTCRPARASMRPRRRGR